MYPEAGPTSFAIACKLTESIVACKQCSMQSLSHASIVVCKHFGLHICKSIYAYIYASIALCKSLQHASMQSIAKRSADNMQAHAGFPMQLGRPKHMLAIAMHASMQARNTASQIARSVAAAIDRSKDHREHASTP